MLRGVLVPLRAEPLIVHSTIYSTLVECDVIARESKQIIEYSTFSVVSIDRHSYPHSTLNLKPISQ